MDNPDEQDTPWIGDAMGPICATASITGWKFLLTNCDGISTLRKWGRQKVTHDLVRVGLKGWQGPRCLLT